LKYGKYVSMLKPIYGWTLLKANVSDWKSVCAHRMVLKYGGAKSFWSVLAGNLQLWLSKT